MKKHIVLFILVSMMTGYAVTAQKFAGMQKSPTDIAYARTNRDTKPDIKVIYSRPQKKDREIFGKLVPYDAVWRTGADEATEIRFFKDMKMGDNEIKAGTYSLFTIPGANEWTIIINSDTDVWGAYSYDESKDIARIQVPVLEGKSLDAFSITFMDTKNGYDMALGWDDVMVKVPFTTL